MASSPRIDKASFLVMGWPANRRNASVTASVVLRRWERSFTTCRDSSSLAMRIRTLLIDPILHGSCTRWILSSVDRVTDTVHGLLSHVPIGDHAIAAVGWSIGIAGLGYLWTTRLHNCRRAAGPK